CSVAEASLQPAANRWPTSLPDMPRAGDHALEMTGGREPCDKLTVQRAGWAHQKQCLMTMAQRDQTPRMKFTAMT
ncbi:MAG: hypothetical protein ACPIOQ_61105, partial [Promethearchaeia archaeon]